MAKLSHEDWVFSKTHTYDTWLQRYKDKTVHELTLNEHTKFSTEYKRWKVGNIEKMT